MTLDAPTIDAPPSDLIFKRRLSLRTAARDPRACA